MVNHQSGPATSPASPYRVLIVEDSYDGLQALARILESQGFEVVEALDAGRALEAFDDRGPFDAALIDLILPDQDGRELCRIVRDRSPRGIVVALLTGWSVEDSGEDLGGWGIDMLFPKPLDIPDLLHQLRTAIETRRGVR